MIKLLDDIHVEVNKTFQVKLTSANNSSSSSSKPLIGTQKLANVTIRNDDGKSLDKKTFTLMLSSLSMLPVNIKLVKLTFPYF